MTGTMIETGAAALWMGVQGRTMEPELTVSGDTDTTNKYVTYVYTWVTANGEEGAPSPSATANGLLDATWHVTMTAPTPAQNANRSLTKTRIYRSVVSAQGIA